MSGWESTAKSTRFFLEHPAGLAKLATASVNGNDTISTSAADPWQALELLGSRLERSNDIEALDGLEAAVAAFAASELRARKTINESELSTYSS